VLLPLMLAVHVLTPVSPAVWTLRHDHVALFVLSLTIFVFMTNQIHKWAHLEEPPRFVRLLQHCRLILGAEHHQVHHTGQHMFHYCITTGWLNPMLDRIGFFRRSETLIQAISGLHPREDDVTLMG